jgi:hypothetical protein
MEIVTAAAGRERPFPDPIDVDAGDAGDDEQKENEKEALQNVESKGRGDGVSNPPARKKRGWRIARGNRAIRRRIEARATARKASAHELGLGKSSVEAE